MNTIFMNSENGKTSRILLSRTDKIKLKVVIDMLLYQTLAFTIHWKNMKKSCKNNKFKIWGPTWNEKFELSDGSYSVLDIPDYFEYIFKKTWGGY